MPTHLPLRVERRLEGHTGPVHVVTYSKDGGYALTGCQDRRVRLFNPASGKLIKTYEGHGWEVLDVCIATDSRTFASCGGDRQVYLWDVASGAILRRFPGHLQKVNAVAMNEGATVVATGSYDTTVQLWDCRTSARLPIQTLKDAKDSITSLIITPTDIISGSVDGEVRTYDLRAGSLSMDCIGHPVTHVSITSDSNCLLASSLDGRIRLMDRANGACLGTYSGHQNTKSKVRACLSYGDAQIISGSEDGSIVAWDVLESNIVRRLDGHTKSVTTVVAHPKGESFLSAGYDGQVLVWATG